MPVSLMRASISVCIRSHSPYPYGRMTMVPRTGRYRRGKSSAQGWPGAHGRLTRSASQPLDATTGAELPGIRGGTGKVRAHVTGATEPDTATTDGGLGRFR
ncbi:hypothetical protein GCM10010448_57950 [Streptomyces glomeratus]|uniref:Uncharacterized protein n=1 Tax=Streptomyces glomeratus TaxID=284452 RepID=A0ABP6M0T4_9ACTN